MYVDYVVTKYSFRTICKIISFYPNVQYVLIYKNIWQVYSRKRVLHICNKG